MESIIPSISGTTASTMETDFFLKATQYLYGLNIVGTTSTQEDIAAANKLWTSFLQKIGKTNDEFLQAVGNGATPRTEAQKQALNEYTTLYNDYLLGKLDYIYQSEALNLLSSDEIKSRDILFKTFELVLKMLSSLQKNIATISHALEFYTKWQNEYTKQMTKVPLYTAAPAQTATGNLQNIGKSTIGGYGGITYTDILEYAAQQLAQKNFAPGRYGLPEQGIGLEVTATPTDGYSLSFYQTLSLGKKPDKTDIATHSFFKVTTTLESLSKDSVRKALPGLLDQATQASTVRPDNETWWNFDPSDPSIKTFYLGATGPTSYNITWGQLRSLFLNAKGEIPLSGNIAMPEHLKQALGGTLKSTVGMPGYPASPYEATTARTPNDPASVYDPTFYPGYVPSGFNILLWNPQILGAFAKGDIDPRYGTAAGLVRTTTLNEQDAASISSTRQQRRGEMNSQLQLYIDSARAKRDNVQNLAKPIENLVSQAREAIQAQCALLDNISDTLRGMIGAIFRS